MPGGICANNLDGEFHAAARCGVVGMRILGVPLSVAMGGFAEAYFPERTEEEMKHLPVGDRFNVKWDRAIFHGRHPFLGKISVRLRKEAQAFARESTVVGL